MLRTSVSPNIIQGGYRINVIPSEAKATLDVRMLPDEDPDAFLDADEEGHQRPGGRGRVRRRATSRPPAGPAHGSTPRRSRRSKPTSRKHYKTVDAADDEHRRDRHGVPARAKGIQCYGIGPAIDVEDGPKGFGAHSDQERILESELHRFVRFHYDIVADLARAR